MSYGEHPLLPRTFVRTEWSKVRVVGEIIAKTESERFCLLEIVSCRGSRHGLGAVPGAEGTLSRAGAEQNPGAEPMVQVFENTLVCPLGNLSWISAPLFTICPSLALSKPPGSRLQGLHPSRPCCDLASPVAGQPTLRHHQQCPPLCPSLSFSIDRALALALASGFQSEVHHAQQ